jgi:uncharacterized membrane protein
VSRILFLGLGAALMFFGDPNAGKKRRTDVANRFGSARRKLEHGRDVIVRDATNRAHGLIAETRSALETRGNTLLQGPSFGEVAHGVLNSWRRSRWSPAQRALAGAFGAGMATYGYFRGGLRGFAMCAAGGSLLARATTNEEISSLVKGGIHVEHSVVVDSPLEQVYAYWRNLENLPQWMSHVREVRYLGGDRYHWVVDGPAGSPVEWDSELLNVVENQEMTWHSLPGSRVEHSGRVRFDTMGEGTRVHVQLRYYPPAGVIGHAVAKAFGVDPRTELDDDLARMKSAVETGHPPHDAAANRYAGDPGATTRH